MLLDIDLIYDQRKAYKSGETITCLIDVNSYFKLKCKYIKLRIRCPYEKNNKQIFQEYAIAKQRISLTNTDDSYRIGDVAENIILQSGVNRFIVRCKIPTVSDDVGGGKDKKFIRCSLKVTVNANWLPKRSCQDWFRLQPDSARLARIKRWIL